jgi:HEAT repeat protein
VIGASQRRLRGDPPALHRVLGTALLALSVSACGRGEESPLPDLADLSARVRSGSIRDRVTALGEATALGSRAGAVAPALAENLADSDLRIRRASAEALGGLGRSAGPAAAALVRALHDEDAVVRHRAATALDRIPLLPPEAMDGVLDSLCGRDPWVGDVATRLAPKVGPAVLARLEAIVAQDEAPGAGRAGEAWRGAAAPADLVRALADPSPALRADAARGLRERREPLPEPAIPLLVALLEESDPRVEVAARTALVVGGARVVGPLAEALRSDSVALRIGAAKALGEMGPAAVEALDALLRALQDPECRVRTEAVRAVFTVGGANPRTVSALVGALEDSDPTVRGAAGATLTPFGALATEGLLGLLECPDCDVANRAEALLLRLPAEAEPSLREALSSGSPRVRRVAATALGLLGASGRPTVGALEGLLSDEAPVAAAAATALGRIGPAAAVVVPALVRSLEHSDARVRAAAARALGDLAPASSPSAPALVIALQDSEPPVRDAARHGLSRLGPAAVPLLLDAFPRVEPDVRTTVRRLLLSMPREAAPELALGLGDARDEVREVAAESLEAIGAGAVAVVPRLVDALLDPSDTVRRWAMLALARIGAGAIESLTRALREGPAELRQPAVRTLAAMGAAAAPAVPDLAAALRAESTSDDLKLEVVRTLRAIGPASRSAVPALRTATESVVLRAEAEEVLASLGER